MVPLINIHEYRPFGVTLKYSFTFFVGVNGKEHNNIKTSASGEKSFHNRTLTGTNIQSNTSVVRELENEVKAESRMKDKELKNKAIRRKEGDDTALIKEISPRKSFSKVFLQDSSTQFSGSGEFNEHNIDEDIATTQHDHTFQKKEVIKLLLPSNYYDMDTKSKLHHKVHQRSRSNETRSASEAQSTIQGEMEVEKRNTTYDLAHASGSGEPGVQDSQQLSQKGRLHIFITLLW